MKIMIVARSNEWFLKSAFKRDISHYHLARVSECAFSAERGVT